MLNPQQRKIVEHHGKPLLVVAGAGSGKTKTLAHKVEFLLRELLIPEESILCITFTNKAAKEIGERVRKVSGRELPWVGTFHSIAYRILRRKVGLNFTVADESDTKSLLRGVMREMGIAYEDYEKVRRMVSRVKEDLGEIRSEELREVFSAYQSALRENGLFDFGDLLFELYNVLLKDERLREDLRRQFRFIIVDEYQDTNTVQYEILRLMAGRDVCVVGDPNQCIYEWRFARPDNIVRFIEDFNPDIVKLETNYRSKGYILSVANSILKKSRAEWRELIPTLVPVRDMGTKPTVRRFESEEEEAIWIGEEIRELLGRYEPGDIAVLVRVSHVTDSVESALFRMRIPFKVVGTLRFYERAEVKNILYFLRFLLNPSDRLAFRRVVTYFVEGIGERTLERLEGTGEESLIRALERLQEERGNVRIRYLLDLCRSLRDNLKNYPEVIRRLLKETPYLEILQKKHRGDLQERLDNVRELIRTSEESLKEGMTLEEFLSEAMLQSSQEEEENTVRIMTVHSAKGLEFSAVFVPRLEEEIFPHRSALEDEDELEEERRLFYVAVTRAKDVLYFSYTKAKGRKPSRFLSEIPKGLLNLEQFRKRRVSYGADLKPNSKVRIGILVNHRVFGIGRVIALEGERATVDFKGRVKAIHTAFLEVLD